MLKKLPLPFFIILLAGIALGLIMSFKAMMPYLYWGEMENFIWYRSALPHILNYLFWPVLVPFIYATFLKFKIGKEGSNADKLITIAISFVIPFLHELVTTIIYFFLLAGLDIVYFNENIWLQVKAAFPGVYIGRVVEFWIIYGLFAAFDYYKRLKNKQAELSRIESQLNRTKLEVLKMQLQPHFLFNALNTISSLMEIDVKKAQLVTARLGDLLRVILEQDSRLYVSLEEELDYVRTYLDIEKIRFEDRLEVNFDVDESLLGFSVPLLIVQPLVENAIKHGVAKVSRKGTIIISVKKHSTGVIITVSDDGKGEKGTISSLYKHGIGLQNIKERLKEIYKEEASVNITAGGDRGFTVDLIIPKHRNYENN